MAASSIRREPAHPDDALADSRGHEPSSVAGAIGGEHGIAQAMHLYHPIIYRACRARLSPADAEDAAQAVFIVLARRTREASRAQSLIAWLLRVADFVVLRARRASVNRVRFEQAAAATREANTVEREGAIDDDLLATALASLPHRERAAIELHYLAGKTLDETGAALGAPANTANTWIRRGVDRLRRRLRGREAAASLAIAALTARAQAASYELTCKAHPHSRGALSDTARQWAQEANRTMIVHAFTTPIAIMVVVLATVAGVAYSAEGGASGPASTPAATSNPTAPPLQDAPVTAAAHCQPQQVAAAPNSEFARIKDLLGTWEMVGPDGGRPNRIVYTLTSAGNAVAERIFQGTPNEMLSVYFVHKGKLHMVHYCSIGNRPEMALDASDQTTMHLGFVEGCLDDPNEQHMHELTITRPDADHFKQSWKLFDGGREREVAEFSYVRVK